MKSPMTGWSRAKVILKLVWIDIYGEVRMLTSLKAYDLIGFQLLNHLLSEDDRWGFFCLLRALRQVLGNIQLQTSLHQSYFFVCFFRKGCCKSLSDPVFSEERIQSRNTDSADVC